MNVKEYHEKYTKKGKAPLQGMCEIVKKRGMTMGPDCIECQEFFVQEREVTFEEGK